MEPISEDSGSKERARFYLYCRQNGLWPREVAGWDPVVEAEALLPYCPAHNVDRNYPPTLLLHGDRDTDVPYELSVTMDNALARAGVQHALLTIPGSGHAFDGAGEEPVVKEAFAPVVGFLKRHLG